jgi:hypothetical protein
MLIHPTVERLRALGLTAMADAFIELGSSNPSPSSEESANHWFLLRRKACSFAGSSEPQQRNGKGEEALVTLCEPC